MLSLFRWTLGATLARLAYDWSPDPIGGPHAKQSALSIYDQTSPRPADHVWISFELYYLATREPATHELATCELAGQCSIPVFTVRRRPYYNMSFPDDVCWHCARDLRPPVTVPGAPHKNALDSLIVLTQYRQVPAFNPSPRGQEKVTSSSVQTGWYYPLQQRF